jgi:4'-phosphopantetheinyl transferase EntD
VIEELLPPSVVTLAAFQDLPDLPLPPEEEACIAWAVDARRREFATCRHLARSGLEELGLPFAVIPRGDRGAPCWPDGVVGSITHCAGYRAVAVARGADIVTVGIDAEPHDPLSSRLLESVSTPTERARLAALSAVAPAVAWDRLLFSVKESVYKAWFPLTKAFLRFSAVDVVLNADATFVARFLVPGPTIAGEQLRQLSGRFAVRDGFVVTAVLLARSHRQPCRKDARPCSLNHGLLT